ncbi:c-type cytochrome biogenesis protein CcsB [Solibacillus sp. FSL H8-0523]|uniref:c-type cytochrome biogenesis protein CcsB n=2 Tax=Solibacillus sp. FSL H8-0523 TaxID=2954511 RepID=UPI00310179D8
MDAQQLLDVSSNLLMTGFILMLIAIVPLGLSVKSNKKLFGKLGIVLTYVSFILQLGYFITRWMAVKHAPVSNMFEFMTFFGIMLVGGFLLIYHMYKQVSVGLFVIPVSLIVIGYGSVFTSDASPLVPSLKSNWLAIHVITVAMSSAILSISFATGMMYLLKVLDVTKKTISSRSLEFVLYCLIVVVGFIGASTVFGFTTEQVTLNYVDIQGNESTVIYEMYPLIVNENKQQVGILTISNKIDAAKLNSITWAFLVGTLLYIVIRIITRKSISQLLKPLTKRVNANLMDEISYRAVVIGFPLFALGGLLFAMIWAQIAWGRFWGWDPKEVWALITFLFYAAMLHLRLSKSWEGEKTAWMAIIGFGIIIFNQIFVNLVIAGLHSYA